MSLPVLILLVATLRLNVEAAQRFIGHAIGSGPLASNTPSKDSDENIDNSNTTPNKSKADYGDKKISPGKRERSNSKRTPKEDQKRRKR